MTQEQELIGRLREYGDEPQDVSMGEWAEWSHKAADMIEALRAQLDKAREVKPLVWVENSRREYWYTASGMGVQYEVKEIGLGKWWLSIDGEMLTVPFDYAHNAKAAAQSDYQRRYNAMSAQEGD